MTVSNGSEKKEVEVPNLGGLTEAQARDSLTSKKLNAGNVTHENSDSVAAGMVISQNPARGTTVTEGDSVDFVISDGPKAKTYTASISGTIARTDDVSVPDETEVTVQVQFNGQIVFSKNITIKPGATYDVSATVPGLSSTGGSANFIIVDASGNNVTAAFSGTTPEVSYSEE